MVFRNSFRMQVVLRVALLAALLVVLSWSLARTRWDAVPLVCAVLAVMLLVELIRYVEAGTRDLASLLRSVAAGDFATALPPMPRRRPFMDYEQAASTLVRTYRDLSLRRAASDELLQAVIEHVGVAVLCFTGRGRVVFANAQARALLDVPVGGTLESLATIDSHLPAQLLALQDEARLQFDLTVNGEATTLWLQARRFTLLDESHTVVVFHDIREELESRDVQAWQAITRVLTHEMMNSLTPILSLSAHLRDNLSRVGAEPDLADSIEVIHARGSGLAQFILAYRQFAHPPVPVQDRVDVATLLERIATLKGPELAEQGIELDVIPPAEELAAWADPRQVEQILLNLLRNAQQALEMQPRPRIELHGERDAQGSILLQVTDNGPGIAPALRAQVFMPFFSTRKGGSGIGLALSRQLARLNDGRLTVSGEPGQCRFTLRLPSDLVNRAGDAAL